MKKKPKNKIMLASILLIAVGMLFLLLEKIFYGGVDAAGVLSESLFLPLGMISLLFGIFLFLFLFFRNLLTILFTHFNSNPKNQ